MDISIIVPVYNEEKNICNVLHDIETSMRQEGDNYEIIVVNDGSSDNFFDTIKKTSIKIKLFEHSNNIGYGAALKTGIKHSLYNILVIIDGDGTYPSCKIPELIREMKNADMVVGARVGDDAKVSFLRKLGKQPIVKLAEYLTNTKIPDLNSGLRVMKKEIVNEFIYLLPNGFSFTSTITLAMLTNGYKVKYMPIPYQSRHDKSKFHPIRDTLNFLQLTIRTVMYFNPLRVFLPLSLFFFIFSLITLLYRFFHRGGLGILTVILFLIGIQFLTTGMLADLVTKKLNS